MAEQQILYDTQARAAVPFRPADASSVTFYSCGPTVYDDAHIGNFRSFLIADLARRWLEHPLCVIAGPDGAPHRGPRAVRQVMNITDVGHMTDDDAADGGGQDKMELAGQRLAEAKKAGRLPEGTAVDANDPRAIAGFYAGRFLEDAERLGLRVAAEARRHPERMPRASEHVEEMKRVIAALLERGLAYSAGEPGARAVYFDVRRFDEIGGHRYGELSGNTLEHLRGGAGGRVSERTQAEKRHPADFLLWKEDERHLMKWPSPLPLANDGWGMGYPGWHIECTAMAFGALVPGGLGRVLTQTEGAAADGSAFQIDLHSGGEDNIFPHHECENAQSCALTGAPRFARHWLHVRYLMVGGKKMSKSAGTFHTARDLFAQGHEPAAVRLELIKTHYRQNADFSTEGLRASAKTVERWRRFAGDAGGHDPRRCDPEHPVARAFAEQMHDDLNIAGALGVINKWINETPEPTRPDAELLAALDGVVGLLGLPRLESTATGIGVYLPGAEPSDEIESLLAKRAAARKAKDFATADAIRDELASRGLTIKDAAGGKVEVGRV